MHAPPPTLMFAALIFALGGCASSPDDAASTEDVAPPFRGGVTYALQLSDDDLTVHPEGGWSTTNDQGVTFHVARGGLIVQNLQLTSCDPLHRGHQHGHWTRWLGIGDAYAGHGVPEDPSAVTIPRYIEAAAMQQTPLSIQTTADGLYCGVHFLVARLRGNVAEGPSAPAALQGHSVWLEGTWRLANTDANIAFRVQATEAFGARTELFDDMPTHLDQSFSDVNIVGSANRSSWFDGVNPRKMDQRTIRRLVLRNVVESIEWSGQPIPREAATDGTGR